MARLAASLLEWDVEKRLGSGDGGSAAVMSSDVFTRGKLNWLVVSQRSRASPLQGFAWFRDVYQRAADQHSRQSISSPLDATDEQSTEKSGGAKGVHGSQTRTANLGVQEMLNRWDFTSTDALAQELLLQTCLWICYLQNLAPEALCRPYRL